MEVQDDLARGEKWVNSLCETGIWDHLKKAILNSSDWVVYVYSNMHSIQKVIHSHFKTLNVSGKLGANFVFWKEENFFFFFAQHTLAASIYFWINLTEYSIKILKGKKSWVPKPDELCSNFKLAVLISRLETSGCAGFLFYWVIYKHLFLGIGED